MRSVAAGSFMRLTEPLALWQAWLRCRLNKRRRVDIATFDVEADRHILGLSRALRSGFWHPGVPRLRLVHDPKPRCVAVTPVIDRVVHQAILGELGPTYARGFIDQSYGCLPGRGPHQALIRALGELRRHRNWMVLDVARFFASIPQDVLLGLWARRVNDRDTLQLIERIITSGGRIYQDERVRKVVGTDAAWQRGRGVPVGSYFSHFSGSLVLDGLDHYVKRTLKIRGWIRYMDDMLLFGDDPVLLLEQRDSIASWLARERGLTLKNPLAPPHAHTEPLDFLGYRLTRGQIRPGPKLRRNVKKRLTSAAARGPVAFARTAAAYRGLLAW